MMIGTFKIEGGGYTGQLDALGLSVANMSFCPVSDKKSNGPDFIVIGYGKPDDTEISPSNNSYEVGAAWKKTNKKGAAYLSVKLDGPTLAAPFNCVLVGRNDGTYRLIWTRKDEDTGIVEEQTAADL